MANNDQESIPETYPYSWYADSPSTLDDFLAKHKPSMIQNDGTKPWIWVSKLRADEQDRAGPSEAVAVSEATQYLADITEKIEEIKNDASIPTRSNKKTGAKSKKERREELHTEATAKFKDISLAHRYTSGKWLAFATAEKVDAVWARLARALVTGPLAGTAARAAKVATSPAADVLGYQHVLCLYVSDVYDRAAVSEIMKVLLRSLGMRLSGVKSDLYTLIGLDSKHASGIPSTVWKNTALISESEMKALTDAYFAEAGSNAAGASVAALPKKQGNTQFESDEEDGEAPPPVKAKPASKTKPASAAKTAPKAKAKAATQFESDEDEAADGPVTAPAKDKTAPAKRKAAAAKQAAAVDGDDSDDDAPKKKKKLRL